MSDSPIINPSPVISIDWISNILYSVNRCQLEELKKISEQVLTIDGCTEFLFRTRDVQSAVIHTYQLTAFAAIRQTDPLKAASLWKEMADFCDSALETLRDLKIKNPQCGTSELYDLTLDYKAQVQKRYIQNLQDAECQEILPGLFAEKT